ncbi:hypothetical protein C8F01DRAFT_1286042 [Mycena amicta]|nr:hypothetical protein C8F01DRAFT_1286042 [Mycena amicta]
MDLFQRYKGPRGKKASTSALDAVLDVVQAASDAITSPIKTTERTCTLLLVTKICLSLVDDESMLAALKWLLGYSPDEDTPTTASRGPPPPIPPRPNLATRPNGMHTQAGTFAPQAPTLPAVPGQYNYNYYSPQNGFLPPPQGFLPAPLPSYHPYGIPPPGYYPPPPALPFAPGYYPYGAYPYPPLALPHPPALPQPPPPHHPAAPQVHAPPPNKPSPPENGVTGTLAAAVDAAKSPSPYQWVDGNVTFQWTAGEEPPGVHDSGWVFRSSGSRKEGVPEDAFDVDKKNCQGYIRCDCVHPDGAPRRLFRPTTHKVSLAKQLAQTCSICRTQLVHIKCPGSVYVLTYQIAEGTGTTVVRKHLGIHDHPRPPVKQLTVAQNDALDELVRTNPNTSALALRAGASPGQIPLGEINPVLLDARKARAEVEKSHARLGIGAQLRGGSTFGLLDTFRKLKASFDVPWFIDSDLLDKQFICMQTPAMRKPFPRGGVLLTSLVFSPILLRWVVVLYTWIGNLDESHHETHFTHLIRSMFDVCTRIGIPIDDHILASILDFSTAQRNGFVEAFIAVMTSRIPGWNDLSERSRAEERENLRRRAQAILLGCAVHWQRTVFRVKAMLRPEFVPEFERLIRVLESSTTTAEEFLDAAARIYREYKELRAWIFWWLLPGNGAMIFPAMQLMSPELQARVSGSTNAAESSHHLLYVAAGQKHDLAEGCRRLLAVQLQVEASYEAVLVGNVQARFQGLIPRASSRMKPYYPSDGPPDTRRRLEEVAELEGKLVQQKAALVAEVGPAKKRKGAKGKGKKPSKKTAKQAASTNKQVLKPAAPSKAAVSSAKVLLVVAAPAPASLQDILQLLLQGTRWRDHSCFIDSILEALFRAFMEISEPDRHDLLRAIDTEASESGISQIFQRFQQRRQLIEQPSHKPINVRLGELQRFLTEVQEEVKDWHSAGGLLDTGDYQRGRGGCPRTLLAKIVVLNYKQAGTTPRVTGYFRITHNLHYECAQGHITVRPQTGVPIIPHFKTSDVLMAQKYVDPELGCLRLDDYLAHEIPCAADTTSLHDSPAIACNNPQCSELLKPRPVSTDWPLFLSFDPKITHPLATNIPTPPLPASAQHCVGVLWIKEIAHYRTKVRVQGRTYIYDGLVHGGKLEELGPISMLEEDDPKTWFVIYVRTSLAMSKRTTRFCDKIQGDADDLPDLAPLIFTDNDAAPSTPVVTNTEDEFNLLIEESLKTLISDEEKRRRAPDYTPSPSPTRPSTPISNSPLWCDGCNLYNADGDNVDAEVQCNSCPWWSHIGCLDPSLDYNSDDVEFTLSDLDPPMILLPDPRAENPHAKGVLHYPALFIRRDSAAVGTAEEYLFTWARCSGLGTGHPFLFDRDRKACHDALSAHGDLKPYQIGLVRLPRCMNPNYPEHQNRQLEAIFRASLPAVAKIVGAFDDTDHPVVANFLQYTRGDIRALNSAEWLAKSLGLVLYPELSAVLDTIAPQLFNHFGLEALPLAVQERRIFSVGFALLQILAVQRDLGKTLDLNGNFLDELLNRRVVARTKEDNIALNAMWESCITASTCDVHEIRRSTPPTTTPTALQSSITSHLLPFQYTLDFPSWSSSSEMLKQSILMPSRKEAETHPDAVPQVIVETHPAVHSPGKDSNDGDAPSVLRIDGAGVGGGIRGTSKEGEEGSER